MVRRRSYISCYYIPESGALERHGVRVDRRRYWPTGKVAEDRALFRNKMMEMGSLCRVLSLFIQLKK